MADKYNFQYVPPSGVITGLEFEEQTEKGINEVGELAYESMKKSESTEENVANQIAVIEGVANNALVVANEADLTANEALDTVLSFDSDLTTIKNSITTINTELAEVKTTADNAETLATTAENKSNDNANQITGLTTRMDTAETNIESIRETSNFAHAAALNALNNFEKISEYSREENAVNLNSYFELDKILILNTSSTNLPVEEMGFLDIDVSEEDSSNDFVVRQTYFSLDTSTSYVRIGTATYDSITGVPSETWWGSWQSSGGSGSTGNVGDIRFPAMTVKDNELKLNGAVLNRADYPLLWQFAQTTQMATETDYSNNGHWGKFSTGDGSTTFRLPDMRGVFLRVMAEGRTATDPDGHSRSIGQAQGDAIWNMYGRIGMALYTNVYVASGPFYYAVSEGDGRSSSGGNRGVVDFNASRQVPTSGDNRPINLPYYAVIRYK